MIRTILFLVILHSCTSLLAQEPQAGVPIAAQTQPARKPDNTTPSAPEGWHFALSPYLWLSGIHGTVGVGGRDASVHAGFGDIISNLNLGLMAASELRHKRLLLLTDLMWIKLSEDKGLPENQLGEITAKSRVQNFMLGPEVGYRFIEQPRLNVDAFTGFRYWHLGSSLEFEPNLLGQKFSTSQNWVDPLLGARLQTPLSPKLRFTVLGDVGGFGAGSQLEWQVAGLLGYQLNKRFTLQAGYRYLDVNYRSGGFKYDVAMSGLLLGTTIHFK
jgi:hypothetical protein